MGCECLAVFGVVAGNMRDDRQFTARLRHHIFEDSFSLFHTLVDTLAGGTAHIKALYALPDEIPGQRADAFRADLPIVIIAGIECRNNALVF